MSFENFKLGRLPKPPHADKAPDLENHIAAHLVKAISVPSAVDWTKKLIPSNIPMDGNDVLGDCTAAAVSHAIAVWTVNVNWAKPTILTRAETINIYEETTGYNPNNPATDQGGIEIDVLNYWLNKGVAVPHGLRNLNSPPATDKLVAFAKFNPQNTNLAKAAIWMYGLSYIGLNLPLSAQTQQIWDVTNSNLTGNAAPGSWGGHAVPIVGYNSEYIKFITWGTIMEMTWAFFNAYAEESYALLSLDWINGKGYAPNDLPFTQLRANMPDFN